MPLLKLPTEILHLGILRYVIEGENAPIDLEESTMLRGNDHFVVCELQAAEQAMSGRYKEPVHLPKLVKPTFLAQFTLVSKAAHRAVIDTAKSICSTVDSSHYPSEVTLAAKQYLSHLMSIDLPGSQLFPNTPHVLSVRCIVKDIHWELNADYKPEIIPKKRLMSFADIKNAIIENVPFYAHTALIMPWHHLTLEGKILKFTWDAQNNGWNQHNPPSTLDNMAWTTSTATFPSS